MDPVATTPLMTIPLGTLIEGAFYLLVGLYAIFTAILYFHWQAYSVDVKVTGFTLGLYMIASIPLIIIMGVMVLIT